MLGTVRPTDLYAIRPSRLMVLCMGALLGVQVDARCFSFLFLDFIGLGEYTVGTPRFEFCAGP